MKVGTQQIQSVTDLIGIETSQYRSVALEVDGRGHRTKPGTRFKLAQPAKATRSPRCAPTDPDGGCTFWIVWNRLAFFLGVSSANQLAT
jgi:hypothetical protein